ncbi:MAG: gluconate 2-dehydrogenase subunit 3 family protein [Actinobacteria bacterium]|nr:gluconate 2-dehydrogenase subunit 3 family protein [Actinomycetota bacterium]
MIRLVGPVWLSPEDHAVVAAAGDRLVPGSAETGVADYVDTLLGAFEFDPPRIWAGGPFSGRHGGEAGFDSFLALGAVEELAWRTRIEGSRGLPEREFNGPVRGLQEEYRDGLASLGTDFATLSPEEQDARLGAVPEFKALLYRHACEGMYGDPVYGGNRGGAGWAAIGFAGDVQPRGWTAVEMRPPAASEDGRPPAASEDGHA